jgi:hypothetical protein
MKIGILGGTPAVSVVERFASVYLENIRFERILC